MWSKYLLFYIVVVMFSVLALPQGPATVVPGPDKPPPPDNPTFSEPSPDPSSTDPPMDLPTPSDPPPPLDTPPSTESLSPTDSPPTDTPPPTAPPSTESPPTDTPSPTEPPPPPPPTVTPPPLDTPPPPTVPPSSSPSSSSNTDRALSTGKSISVNPFVSIPPISITATNTQAITPVPTTFIAQNPYKTTIDLADNQIQYAGDWSTATSSCDSSVSAVKCTTPRSVMSYRFKSVKGGALYLGSAQDADAGIFVVILDGLQNKFDGFSAMAETNCSFTFAKDDLSAGSHSLTVLFEGPSPQSQSQGGSFTLQNLELVGQDTSASSGSKRLLSGISLSATFIAGLLGILLV